MLYNSIKTQNIDFSGKPLKSNHPVYFRYPSRKTAFRLIEFRDALQFSESGSLLAVYGESKHGSTCARVCDIIFLNSDDPENYSVANAIR